MTLYRQFWNAPCLVRLCGSLLLGTNRSVSERRVDFLARAAVCRSWPSHDAFFSPFPLNEGSGVGETSEPRGLHLSHGVSSLNCAKDPDQGSSVMRESDVKRATVQAKRLIVQCSFCFGTMDSCILSLSRAPPCRAEEATKREDSTLAFDE